MLLLLASLYSADNAATLDTLSSHRGLRKAAAPTIPADAYTRAFAGEVVSGVELVEGVNAGKAWGVAKLDLPASAVWKAVNSDEVFEKFMPIDHSDVVHGRKHADGRFIFQYMPLPLVDDRWWITKMNHNTKLFNESGGAMMELYWFDHMDRTDLLNESQTELVEDGHPVDFTKGSWLVIDLGADTSLVEYFVWSDPGGALPAGPASQFAGGAMDETMKAITTLAEKHANSDSKGYVYPDGTPVP
jgi:hypothetical protein